MASTRRDDILREATVLFSQFGYRSTSMRDIGSACGMLAGSLYAHVGSKEDILFEVTDKGTDRFLAAIEPVATQAGTATSRLTAMVHTHMRLMAEDIPHALVIFHQWKHLSEPNRTHLTQKRDVYEEFFREVVRDGVKSDEFRESLDPRIAVLTALGALNWVPEWFDPSGPLSASDIADQIVQQLIFGLTSEPAAAGISAAN